MCPLPSYPMWDEVVFCLTDFRLAVHDVGRQFRKLKQLFKLLLSYTKEYTHLTPKSTLFCEHFNLEAFSCQKRDLNPLVPRISQWRLCE